MEQVEERLLRMRIDHQDCALRLGVIGTSVPEIELRDASGFVLYRGLVKDAGEPIEPWGDQAEDRRLEALGYR